MRTEARLVRLSLRLLVVVGAAMALRPAVVAAEPPGSTDALWLRDPAISPDASRIAFTYRGDVWVVPAAGGRAYPLTTHEACDKRPCWSPDGKWVAFASDRFGNFDVFVVSSSGGGERRLTFHQVHEIATSFTLDGKSILFTGRRQDDVKAPAAGWWPQLWSVPLDGGRPTQVLTIPALNARVTPDGSRLVYEDLKSYESPFRKHHVSSAARDLWTYEFATGRHTCLTRGNRGEDRDGWIGPDGRLWFASERGDPRTSSINLYVADAKPDAPATPVTDHKGAPVRSLTMAKDGTLAYSLDGALWVRPAGITSAAKRIAVEAPSSVRSNVDRVESKSDEATEMAVAPDGQEVAFVVRGDVFVASAKKGTTRRVTDTATPERSVAWSKDGKTLYYAGERDGSWNLYAATLGCPLGCPPERRWSRATMIEEKTVLATPDEEFQPLPSPDGKKVAYLHERDEIRVLDLATGKTSVALAADHNYSYEDGDVDFSWSPDGRWIAANAHVPGRWISSVVVIAVEDIPAKDGAAAVKAGTVIDVSRSGYEEHDPVWSPDSRMLTFRSDRFGRATSASWGAEEDVMAVLLTRAARDRFRMTEEEYDDAREDEEKSKAKEREKEGEDEGAKEGDEKKTPPKEPKKDRQDGEPARDDAPRRDGGSGADDAGMDGKGGKAGKGGKDGAAEKDDEEEEKPDPVEIETTLMDERTVRFTPTSAPIAGHAIAPDGETVLFLAQFAKNWGLWSYRPRKEMIRRVAVLGKKDPKDMELSKDGETAFVLDAQGGITKYDVSSFTGPEPSGDEAEGKPVEFSADVRVRGDLERASMFDHVVRQVQRKFYDPTLHGVDWVAVPAHYRRFLPHVAEADAFAELLSEMLGELNASHTGAYHRIDPEKNDRTASLGLLYEVTGGSEAGLRIAEVLPGGPADKSGSRLAAGVLITHIDGVALGTSTPVEPILDRKAGKWVVVRAVAKGGEPFEETVKPVGIEEEREMLYRRFVRGRAALVERLSGGRVGYVHVRDMDGDSFREVYKDALGKHGTKDALVVDTRFNGGGWLHDDLISFLSGREYSWFVPRGKKRGLFGAEPRGRWSRPFAIVVNEANYSDAHFFPAASQALKLAPIVGARIAGTATAVWWETLVDPSVVFGIPQVGMQYADGRYYENAELVPDVEVYADPEGVAKGEDAQIHAAVDLLLKTIK